MQRGYSLIEVMVALAVAGILLAMTVPTYQKAIAIGYRHEARQQLYLQMQEMVTRANDLEPLVAPSLLLPSGRYRMLLLQNTPNLLLRAEAVGAQQIDSECLSLWLDSDGQRGSAPSPVCWEH